ncbi:helix-turn-helix domain-containing protein [Mycolicibacterium tusciae]|uniref:helix-turn-helix transcriptional regulator n=1 Tax=Mycolicibacterium tusciae TaxID=75922 RepID=UPI0011E4FE3A
MGLKGVTVGGKSHVRAGTRGDELLKIDQLASRLKVSVGCIRAWRLRGEGPPAIRIGTALRWDAAEVDEWLDSRRESRLEA